MGSFLSATVIAWVAQAVLACGSPPPSPEQAPSLAAVRSSLASLQGSIIRTTLARAELPYHGYAEEATGLNDIFKSSVNHSWAAQISPDSAFDSAEGFPPFIQYDRSSGAQWGGTLSNSSGSIMSYYYNVLLPGMVATSNFSTIHETTQPTGAGVTLSASFFSLISSRISLGTSVAAAKFAANTTYFCPLIAARNVTELKRAITVASQEEAVKNSVYRQALAWCEQPNNDSALPVVLNSTAGCFSDPQLVRDLYAKYLIPITSDVEVATLLTYKQYC